MGRSATGRLLSCSARQLQIVNLGSLRIATARVSLRTAALTKEHATFPLECQHPQPPQPLRRLLLQPLRQPLLLLPKRQPTLHPVRVIGGLQLSLALLSQHVTSGSQITAPN